MKFNDNDTEWITVSGSRIPIKKGQSKEDISKEIRIRLSPVKTTKKLSDTEKTWLKDYSQDGSKRVNDFLKKGKTSEGYSEKTLKSIISKIDSAIEKSEVKEDSIVYRGIEVSPKTFEDRIGLEIESEGFQSASQKKGAAILFTGFDKNKHSILRIQLKKGTKALDMIEFEEGSTFGESEILLRRGGKYKVNKVSKDNKGNNIIDLDYIESEKEKKNASQMPKVYYCRHIEKGVVGYENEMVLINDDALNRLDQTMAGIPVRVHHVDDIDVMNIQEQSDGYVAESFYLECDGWHWAKFICVSDEAHKRVSEGWSVSNAYAPTAWGGNGVYHNIPYDREITDGKYGHLAIVPNPRYEGSVIMTPEEFKEYKDSKEKELKELQNEKKEKKVMLKLFKKVAVEKEIDESVVIQLKNDKEISIGEIQNTVDEVEALKKENEELKIENKKLRKNTSDEEKEKERLANMTDEEKAAEEKKNQEEKEKEEEKKNEEEAAEKKKEEEKKEEEKKNALKLKDADLKNAVDVIVETSDDKLSRGVKRYGSDK